MNRFILSILVVSFPLQLLGQLFPSSDHYVFCVFFINSAFNRFHDKLNATIKYLNQLYTRRLLYLSRRNLFPVRSPMENMEIEYQIPLRNYNIDLHSTGYEY
jgi:hypothetical protein